MLLGLLGPTIHHSQSTITHGRTQHVRYEELKVASRNMKKSKQEGGSNKKKTATMQTSVCEGVAPSGFGVTTLQLKKFKIPWLSRSLPRGANSTGKFDMRGQLKLAPFWIRAP